ncbi:MAG: hypothetical protein IIC67_06030 [Thaumarchaeota archaeon]|nr:hypothetical protein [Nitrososphaerota archaeon]
MSTVSKSKVGTCRGICNPVYDKRFSYDNRDKTKKECVNCDIFVRTVDGRCPCCRLKTRNANQRSWILKKNRL